mgnify:CR=1 FL=1
MRRSVRIRTRSATPCGSCGRSVCGRSAEGDIRGAPRREREETAAVVASIDVVTAEVLAVSTTEIMTAVTMEVLAPATAEVLVPETAEGSAIMADSVIVIVTVTIVTTVTDEIVVENEIAVGIGIADRPNAKDDPDGAAKQSLENRNLPDILKKFKI